MSKSIYILGTSPNSIVNFRGDLMQLLKNKGINVTAVSSVSDAKSLRNIVQLGAAYKDICLKRNNLNLIDDVKTLSSLLSLFRSKNPPHLILAYGVKLVVWGGLSARITSIPFFALITGLGFAFQGESLKRKLLTKLVVFLYKLALKSSKAVIFQNEDNLNIFVDKGIVPRFKTHVVNGSGVDIKKYNVVDFPKGNIRFLCISRLLGEKGLREYAQAAKIVRDRFPNVEFDLVGQTDPSLDAIPLSEIDSWSSYINYKGSTHDVCDYISNSHVYVLPSYHEGLPRSTLEAMSMGRPVITTNAVGCKETVENSVNGFKVPVKSVGELAEKMIWFVESSDQVKKMGIESRRMIEDKFDVNKVNQEMLKIMGIK